MVATQGLFLLNDDSVMAAAEATARRVLAIETTGGQNARIDQMFELVLNLRATDEERSELLTFIGETGKRLTSRQGLLPKT